MRWSTAAGVGVVVVLAAAIVVAAYVLLASAGVIGNTYPLTVEFDNAQGVTKGTEVRMAGVKIGEVDEVSLSPGNRALLKLRISQRYPVPADADFHLAPTGLLSAPIVEIIPAQRGPLQKNVRRGTSAPTLDEILPNAQQLLTNLTGLTKSMQNIVGDPVLLRSLKQSSANIAEVSERGKQIAANLQAASVSGRQIAAGFRQTTRRLDRTAAVLQQTVTENRGKLGETITSVNDTMLAMKDLVGQVTSVIADPKLKGSLKGTLANMEQSTANLAKLSSNLEKLSADPKLNEDLRATVSNTRATVEETRKLFARLNHVLGSGNKSVAGAREEVERSQVTVDVAAQTNSGRPRLDLNAFFPSGSGGFYRVGINDLSETNKLNVQFGQPLLGNTVRYGLYASRLGFGLDVGPPTHPHLSADLYSLAHPQLDLRARAGIGPGLDLTLGVQSAFHHNTPTVGVTLRK